MKKDRQQLRFIPLETFKKNVASNPGLHSSCETVVYNSSVSIQTDGLFGKKFLLIEVGGNDNYLKDGDKFSFSEDSIVIEELLGKIIEIGEKNKGL